MAINIQFLPAKVGDDNGSRIDFGIFLVHERTCISTNIVLKDEIFDVHHPFFMESEKWCRLHVHDDCKCQSIQGRKRKRNKNSYRAALTANQVLAIEIIVNDARSRNALKTRTDCVVNNGTSPRLPKILHELEGHILGNISANILNVDGYFIPPNCSFQIGDVFEGIETLSKILDGCSVNVGPKFVIVMDPPWNCKSVKRKNNYETQTVGEILRVFGRLKKVINQISECQIAKFGKVGLRLVVWTTNKYKNFVVEQLFKSVNFHVKSCILWEKVTNCGLSVKIRGSPEYLVVGSHNLDNCVSPVQGNGVLVSVASLIHSHKPPVPSSLLWCECDERDAEYGLSLKKATSQELEKSLPKSFCGLELYARYLQQGFHSIGNECIKLQAVNLYSYIDQGCKEALEHQVRSQPTFWKPCFVVHRGATMKDAKYDAENGLFAAFVLQIAMDEEEWPQMKSRVKICNIFIPK